MLLLATGTSASAQTAADSTKPASASAAPATIEFVPARARQGIVLRLTVRSGDERALPDTLVRDSLRAAPVAIRRDVDSLRAVLDTLGVRRDSTRADTLRADSTRVASFAADSTLADGITAISAALFREPLHFERIAPGTWTAIAAIPVDAPPTVRVAVALQRANGAVDSAIATLTVARTPYKMEQLTVAPRFGQAPDSALAARIAREQALAAEVSRRAHDTPRLWEGDFRQPRVARVTSAFGDGRQFNGAVQSRHMGLDLAGAVGAPVLATNRGVVALVGDFYYAGNAVYVDHGAGLVTAYFHLSAVDVTQGDTVTPGMRIGRVGATGRVTGPHLHWVARYGSVTVDPSSLLGLNAPAPTASEPAGGAARGAVASPAPRQPAGAGKPPAAKPPVAKPPAAKPAAVPVTSPPPLPRR